MKLQRWSQESDCRGNCWTAAGLQSSLCEVSSCLPRRVAGLRPLAARRKWL